MATIAVFSSRFVMFLPEKREGTARSFLENDWRFRGGQLERTELPRDVSIDRVYQHASPQEAGLAAVQSVQATSIM